MPVLPPRPRTSDMTFWSRHEAVRQPRGNTDNWAKMRVRANTYRANNSLDGLNLTSVADMDPTTASGARFQFSADGVRRLPDPSFTDLMTSQLGGQLPGDLGKLQPSANLRTSWLNNEFHRRAKDNFRYWLIERPNPTTFGKYGMGSFKTVLGVGNAPRT